MQILVFLFALFFSAFADYYVNTFSGSGKRENSDGQGARASFYLPTGVASDVFGNVFVADNNNNLIRKINSTGFVSTVAGNTQAAFSDGQSIDASFQRPHDVAVDLLGNILVADMVNSMIRLINASGYVTTLAGNGSASIADGQGRAAALYRPTRLAIDSSGNIFFIDRDIIRKINSTGYVSTVEIFSDGQDSQTSFGRPNGLAIDSLGNLFLADSENNRICKINASGYVSNFAGAGSNAFSDGQGTDAEFSNPAGIATDLFDNLFVADSNNQRIRRIDSSGYVITIAGCGGQGSIDGAGSTATFNIPLGINVDINGTIFVTDMDNSKIRKIQYQSTTTVFASPTLIVSIPSPTITVTLAQSSSLIATNTLFSTSIVTLTSELLSNVNTDPALKALILVFTGPTAYVMIVLGSVSGILFAKQRMKKDDAIRLQQRFLNQRQNVRFAK